MKLPDPVEISIRINPDGVKSSSVPLRELYERNNVKSNNYNCLYIFCSSFRARVRNSPGIINGSNLDN